MSASECSASASIALLPESVAATGLATAIAEFAARAMKTLRRGLCWCSATSRGYPPAHAGTAGAGHDGRSQPAATARASSGRSSSA